jgi:DNA modification methylase
VTGVSGQVLYENQILLGACLEVLRGLPDSIFDACVMDPPYGLGNHEPTPEEILAYLQGADLDTGGDFMGKDWEIPSVLVWRELARVLKPGAHVLSFGGTRTFDLISMGARMAGFERRDSIADLYPALLWLHGQGFPKSLNVSKEIDKDLGVEREVVGTYRVSGNALTPTKEKGGTYVTGAPNSPAGDLEITKAGSKEAKHWEGWGTALKPAWEPILMFRKPLAGKVIDNVREHGTGAINIDATRVVVTDPETYQTNCSGDRGHEDNRSRDLGFKMGCGRASAIGRWPSNLVLAHAPGCKRAGFETVDIWECVEGCPVRDLDEQSGELESGDSGGASRFFPQFEGAPFKYVSKPGKKEATLDGQITNNHPTKKPLKLMQWLVKLVTPEGGIVLDPYCGSGTTLHAACEEGFRFTGIERDAESYETSRQRMEIVQAEVSSRQGQEDLFSLAMNFDEDDFDGNLDG